MFAIVNVVLFLLFVTVASLFLLCLLDQWLEQRSNNLVEYKVNGIDTMYLEQARAQTCEIPLRPGIGTLQHWLNMFSLSREKFFVYL